jgi:hypothetical protein
MQSESLLALMFSLGTTAASGAFVKSILSSKAALPTVWYEVQFGRDVDEEAVRGWLRSLAADRRPWVTALEIVGTGGVLHFRIGLAASVASSIAQSLRSSLIGTSCEIVRGQSVTAPRTTYQLTVSSKGRQLRANSARSVAHAVLGVLSSTKRGEVIVLQWC